MMNLREADITQICFYQQVLEMGEKEEANIFICQLIRDCGNLSNKLQAKVRSRSGVARSLSIPLLESFGKTLLDF